MSESVLAQFGENVQSVYQLAGFDHFIVEIALRRLGQVEDRLRRNPQIQSDRYSVQQAITHFETFRTNDSMRIRYESMFNQCVVLLVSYFESAAREAFRDSLASVLADSDPPNKLLSEKLTFTVSELAASYGEGPERLAELFLSKRDPSFADMKSLREAFADYVGVDAGRDELTNTVIFAQASRHAIVHAAAIADSRFVNQIRGALPRRVKQSVNLNEKLVFDEKEIKDLGDAMIEFLGRLVPSTA